MESKTKIFFSAAFTLAGTIIGAGILGLPYVFAKSGFFVGVFWLLFLGLIMVFVNLCIGEVTLRTKKTHQLPGYAEKYLGKWGKRLMVFAVLFGIYSALLAYIIGEGQSLSQLFFGDVQYALFFGVVFWSIMTLLLQGGLRSLKEVELWGVLAIIILVIVVSVILSPSVEIENLSYMNIGNFFLPFGVVLFAFLGFQSIPEMRRELIRNKKMLRNAIIVGSIIPIILYLLFSFVFVGILGESVAEVATLSFDGVIGKVLLVLGIFAMATSFFVLSFALRDYFIFDLKKKKLVFYFVSLLPLALYLIVTIFSLTGFAKVIGIGGAVSGGFVGILALFMNWSAKRKGERNPEYKIPINLILAFVLSLILAGGILIELFF